MIQVTDDIIIDERELEETFSRSSGPGGQNVNKVSSAVTLKFDVKGSPNLPDAVRDRLLDQAANQITDDGVLMIRAQRFRTRERNRRDARDRLIGLIRKACTRSKPRKKTKPSRQSVERRLQEKRQRSQIKSTRGRVSDEE